ncbi:thermonuclease family protein [Hyphomonas oceanitis]|uniref:Nuclease domain-containing protein n=1 Tax=Hyphomonas oceanitis SCH89 TaxID=1280953 RepID=A0A059GBU5_9PROT|nr:thermonuclease family protein [Hyphomonas oceanitis]KDA04214.1 nuclease domain-containing protein [Hyphomonas oceanitis SCH89]
MRYSLASPFAILLFLAACGQMGSEPRPSTPSGEGSSRIEGVASVIDGDTIEIHGQRIRLSGFDAPERGKVCGATNVYQKAALYLSDQVGTRTVTCKRTGTDSYDRAVATCRVSGTDLGQIMVGAGWARDWPKYSHGAYADAEARARGGHKGIWNLHCPDDLWGSRRYD